MTENFRRLGQFNREIAKYTNTDFLTTKNTEIAKPPFNIQGNRRLGSLTAKNTKYANTDFFSRKKTLKAQSIV